MTQGELRRSVGALGRLERDLSDVAGSEVELDGVKRYEIQET